MLNSLALVLCLCFLSQAQAQSITRTYWQYLRGPGAPNFSPNPSPGGLHGNMGEYANLVIPPVSANGWIVCGQPGDTFCTDATSLGVQSASRLTNYCNCMQCLDPTWFQTFITVPQNTIVTQFTINFQLMDDGCRVSIFNSVYPNGLTINTSYVYLGQQVSDDFSQYLVVGSNRVVITQVDDCPVGNNIIAVVTLNNQQVPCTCQTNAPCVVATPTTGGGCQYNPAPDGTPCNDGNTCTSNEQCLSGACTGTPTICSNCGDVCNPGTGSCPPRQGNKICYCGASYAV